MAQIHHLPSPSRLVSQMRCSQAFGTRHYLISRRDAHVVCVLSCQVSTCLTEDQLKKLGKDLSHKVHTATYYTENSPHFPGVRIDRLHADALPRTSTPFSLPLPLTPSVALLSLCCRSARSHSLSVLFVICAPYAHRPTPYVTDGRLMPSPYAIPLCRWTTRVARHHAWADAEQANSSEATNFHPAQNRIHMPYLKSRSAPTVLGYTPI